ncbi:MAG: response regulator transcription factor [Bacteroidales bacterium]|jgi:two-component system alkaline phosphatase synthesis response regulator PhoP|nr:response regulator transcription factor [Bacteroidales bacterium]MDD3166095.1 response regulator transcription factor [Bacteroidales bacterium]MDD4770946.1 response regulator transcription factor [Bacteroidales bacterium]HKL92660.1 response regulator transcription factor [Bacteroidales bacterium]
MKPLQSNVLIFSAKGSILATKVQDSLLNTRAEVEITYSVQKASEFIQESSPCLVFIDTPSDDVKAEELCKKIKKTKEENRFNIYFLVDNNSNLEEQLKWFDLGVDEIGTRDTNAVLITRRVQNILGKYIGSPKDVVPQQGIVIDRERYLVYKDGNDIFLPRKEFELLVLLASKPLKVFTREDIFKIVWGNKSVVGDRTIDVHVRKIREKIGEKHIATIKGVGYKFVG